MKKKNKGFSLIELLIVRGHHSEYRGNQRSRPAAGKNFPANESSAVASLRT